MTDSSCWQKERGMSALGWEYVPYYITYGMVIYYPDLKLAPHVWPIFGEFCQREQFSVWLFRIHYSGLAGMVR